MDTQQPKKKFYKKWWFWVMVVVILFIIGVSGSSNKNNTSNTAGNQGSQQSAQPSPKEETIKITAVKLSEEYKANEVAADSKYKGKAVEVTGFVDAIGKDLMNTPYIALKSYEYAIVDKVQCMFAKSDESKLVDVKQGQQITLRGEVSGKIGNILVNGCQIVK